MRCVRQGFLSGLKYLKEYKPQNSAQQNDLGDADLPFEQQQQINQANEDSRDADCGINDIVGLAEGGDYPD